jgi:diguanylate cyclase (GGDEF)-like protein
MIAEILTDKARDWDGLVARYGGEEFILVVPRADLAGASLIAEQIRTSIENRAIPAPRLRDMGRHPVVTASFGVSSCSHLTGGQAVTCPCTPAGLIHRADQSLYAAKKAGRNRVHCV